MNNIEDRLRDAYRSATDTVRPEAIRGRGEPATVISPSARWSARSSLHRWLVPLTAAAAVVLVGVVAGVVVPDALHDARNQGNDAVAPPAGNPATHFLVGLADTNANYLSIRSAITGAAVATLAPPRGGFFGAVATSDGRSYVVAVGRPGQCHTQLLQFKISRTGQPSRLTSFIPLSAWFQMIEYLAISRSGRTLAVAGLTCQGPGASTSAGPGKAEIGVIVTRQVSKTSYRGRGTFWTVPSQSFVNSLSLTADGRQIEFSTDKITNSPSDVYLLPTNAAAGGSALRRSRVVVRAAGFQTPTAISGSVMTPDGKTVYFATFRTGRAFDGRWALRSVDVATGRSRLLTEKPGFGVHIVASPSVRELIAFVPTNPPPPPLPVVTPSPSPSGTPSAPTTASPTGAPSPIPSGSLSPGPTVTPSPIPSGSLSPGPTVTPTPIPSGSPSRSPSTAPTVTPTPIPSGSPSIAPRPAPTLAAVIAAFDVIRIQLPGGRDRYLNPLPWDAAGFFYTW